MLNSKYLINSRIKINRLIINNMYIIKAVSHVMCIVNHDNYYRSIRLVDYCLLIKNHINI